MHILSWEPGKLRQDNTQEPPHAANLSNASTQWSIVLNSKVVLLGDLLAIKPSNLRQHVCCILYLHLLSLQ